MLTLNNIKPSEGSIKSKKRLGRGNGSGKGTFSGKGCKGQNARSGKPGAWFEGGQTPLFRRTPKLKGFSNHIFNKEFNIINLSDLEKLASKGISTIDKQVLLENGFIRNKGAGVKLLGKGELKSSVQVKVDKASKTAEEAISKASGTLEIISVEKSSK